MDAAVVQAGDADIVLDDACVEHVLPVLRQVPFRECWPRFYFGLVGERVCDQLLLEEQFDKRIAGRHLFQVGILRYVMEHVLLLVAVRTHGQKEDRCLQRWLPIFVVFCVGAARVDFMVAFGQFESIQGMAAMIFGQERVVFDFVFRHALLLELLLRDLSRNDGGAHKVLLPQREPHLLQDEFHLFLLGERSVGLNVHFLQHISGATDISVLFLDDRQSACQPRAFSLQEDLPVRDITQRDDQLITRLLLGLITHHIDRREGVFDAPWHRRFDARSHRLRFLAPACHQGVQRRQQQLRVFLAQLQ
mmetsp:Transcript_23479/g.66444  ORF Transcript_23479/g.66444 Transcript_23479/m.66444 type:complete len:305 (+) Transcript_23479:432-1346(+)